FNRWTLVMTEGLPGGRSPSVPATGSDFVRGHTLYADGSKIFDLDGVGTFAWQWQRSSDNGATWSAVNGATTSDYTLTQADVGKLVRSAATYVDGAGTQETVFSFAFVSGSVAESGATLVGTFQSDTLTGSAGNDVLVGGGGPDSMDGKDGSDIYLFTGNYFHKLAEMHDTGTSGIDEVRFNAGKASTLKIFAGDTGIEKVVVGTGTGTNADSSGTLALNIDASRAVNGVTLIGNAGANKLFGTAFDDTIDGGAGADKMAGGEGNDTYIVDNTLDAIVEKTGADTVMASVSYTLAGTVENLTLTGTDNIDGMGNKLANIIAGNAGSNTLLGGEGNDTITGGAGADTFVFNTRTSATKNVDTISDFSSSDGDQLQFSSVKWFKGLGAAGDLTSDQFWSGADVTSAHDASDRLIYNTSTGDLYYDADGTGAKAAILVAHLTGNPALTFGDIQIIA
ncbi:MAG: calcium-binding protein, partial [Novosphingobium sp.]|uniref:calcium-binding protein n=1 Tax=Novosphingobium sp. TaxID=1874826 RepID=UPI0030179C89